MKPAEKQPLLTLRPKDVEREYGISEQTLANWRSTNRGPAWVPISNRMVLYERSCLDKFFSSRRVEPSRRTSTGKGK
jgi:hypothetical protein